jgi:hypothetical protein
MKILLINPEVPNTFWSLKHALNFVSKKALLPPLGLLTVGAMLPESWEKKLVDMNTTRLRDRHLKWADMVFLTGMFIQKKSVDDIIERCKKLNVKIAAGGPLFTALRCLLFWRIWKKGARNPFIRRAKNPTWA